MSFTNIFFWLNYCVYIFFTRHISCADTCANVARASRVKKDHDSASCGGIFLLVFLSSLSFLLLPLPFLPCRTWKVGRSGCSSVLLAGRMSSLQLLFSPTSSRSPGVSFHDLKRHVNLILFLSVYLFSYLLLSRAGKFGRQGSEYRSFFHLFKVHLF